MSISLVEAVMISTSLVGTWWAFRNTRESERDVKAVVDAQQNGLLLLTATTMRAHQRAFGAIAALVLLIMLTSVSDDVNQMQPVRRVAFMGILVAVVVGSGRADKHRRQLWAYAVEAERLAREQKRRSTYA